MTVPFNKILEAFWVFKYCAEAAKRQSFQSILTALNEVKKHLYAFNVQEMKFRTFIAINRILKTVKNCEGESSCVTGLIYLSTTQVVFQGFNSINSSEYFLVLTAIFANT